MVDFRALEIFHNVNNNDDDHYNYYGMNIAWQLSRVRTHLDLVYFITGVN